MEQVLPPVSSDLVIGPPCERIIELERHEGGRGVSKASEPPCPKKHQHTSTERACVRWGSLFWRHTLMRSSVAARVVKRGRMLIDEEREEMRSEARSLRRVRRTGKMRRSGGSGRAANERRVGGVARAAVEHGHRHAGRDSREGTRAPQRSDGARGDGDRAPPRQAARASRGGTATAGAGSPGRAVLGW